VLPIAVRDVEPLTLQAQLTEIRMPHTTVSRRPEPDIGAGPHLAEPVATLTQLVDQ
jgi:hypothetical protein